MPELVLTYIRWIDALNRFIGRIAMYLIFALVGVLLWSSMSKTFFTPSLWTLETAQFEQIIGSAVTLSARDHSLSKQPARSEIKVISRTHNAGSADQDGMPALE